MPARRLLKNSKKPIRHVLSQALLSPTISSNPLLMRMPFTFGFSRRGQRSYRAFASSTVSADIISCAHNIAIISTILSIFCVILCIHDLRHFQQTLCKHFVFFLKLCDFFSVRFLDRLRPIQILFRSSSYLLKVDFALIGHDFPVVAFPHLLCRLRFVILPFHPLTVDTDKDIQRMAVTYRPNGGLLCIEACFHVQHSFHL
nr:MAG TPA: hypothetical protein [Caudoviricetes sp.]